MRSRKRFFVVLITILLTLSISSNLTVVKVEAPPWGGSSTSGILTSVGSEIQIVDARINMSIMSQPFRDAYHIHTINMQGLFNLTNPSSENASILLLYRPCWEGGSSSFLNISSFETSIEGTPLLFGNQTLVNVTHPRDLPSVFHDRFPEWVYNNDQYWSYPAPFTMLNLSLSPHQSVIFHFSDLITVTSVSINFSEIGFGLGADQVERDSTRIRMQITIIEGSQFIDLHPYPFDFVVTSQEGDNFTFTWDAQPPYPPRLFNGITPIRAGFNVQMEVTEYLFPFTTSTTTPSPTTYSTNPTVQPPPIEVWVPFVGYVLIIFAILILWKRWD